MRHFSAACFIWILGIYTAQAAWVWVEGEQPSRTNIGKHPWYAGEVKKQELSGGEFLAHYDRAKKGEAEFHVDVPVAGEYTLWLRANPVKSSLKLSINEGPLTPVDFSRGQTGNLNIAANGAPDLRFVAWSEQGRHALNTGKNTVRFVMDSTLDNHGSIDCFIFTQEPFAPMGTLKSDQLADYEKKVASENQGWSPWNPSDDAFTESPIDLRHLNEKFAGENGPILARGEQFIHSKSGQPVRFWGINGPDSSLKGEDIRKAVRMLAKRGVNLIRLHGDVFDRRTGAFRPEQMAHKLEIIEAAKQEGIYSHLSIYFPLWLTPDDGPGWREGYDGKKYPFALLYFEPEFQALYRSWWQALLTTKGSTGSCLVDDPALMGVEIINEDSLFFWTFNYENVPAPQMRKLEKRFGDWAAEKHGSIEKALTAWGGQKHGRDDAKEGRLGFRPLYDMFRQKSPRDRDTASFLMETQRKFYEDTVKFLRGLGYKGLITASNWTTANNDVFGPLEKYSYLAGDFTDRHGYFGCNHKGDNAGWSIRNGHTYSDTSALRFDSEEPGKPRRFNHPAMDPMYNSLPSMISETTWNRPNRYRSEAPLFYAVYGALQDSDSVVHFAHEGARWEVKPKFFMQPWNLMTPAMMGQFPAAALVYRQGLVRTGDLMADLPLKLEDALNLKGSKLVQQANLDELRKSDVLRGVEEPSEAGLDPLVHFVGRTNIRIDEKGGNPMVKDLTGFINRKDQTVASSTGELKLDYGKGCLLINATSVQGMSGNLKGAGPAALGDITVTSDLELGHIVAVSLDGLPLATSSRILLQAMTEEKATNFATEPAGNGVVRITNIGQDPWLIRNIQGTVRFNRPDAGRLHVTLLDFNGYPTDSHGNASEIRLLPDKAYYLISK